MDYLKTHVVLNRQAMVMTGTMMEGFRYYGPFKDTDAAHGWAGANVKPGYAYHVLEIYVPNNHD